MKNLDPHPEFLQRLRCAAGHLNAVIKMAEAGEPCEQLLHQLGAVDAAMRAAGARLSSWTVPLPNSEWLS
ncbi:MAG: metal-sensing transcriptional repressor [Anaerolineales bacterium]|nr:metal-sensing transcriptional repressor [Anaerolineales bacterium]